MSRVPQPQGTRGSLKWVQRLTNDHPDLVDSQIAAKAESKTDDRIRWLGDYLC